MDRIGMPKPLSSIPPVGGRVSTAGQRQGRQREPKEPKESRKSAEDSPDYSDIELINAELDEDKGIRIDIQI